MICITLLSIQEVSMNYYDSRPVGYAAEQGVNAYIAKVCNILLAEFVYPLPDVRHQADIIKTQIEYGQKFSRRLI